MARFLTDYPDIRVEFIKDYGLTDIVAERYDAGVRLGGQVAKDTIALRIGPDFHQALLSAPSYFARRPPPDTPHDLTAHACINLRLPASGGLWPWPFAKDGRDLKAHADGPLAFNAVSLGLHAALAGLGLTYLPEDVVRQRVPLPAITGTRYRFDHFKSRLPARCSPRAVFGLDGGERACSRAGIRRGWARYRPRAGGGSRLALQRTRSRLWHRATAPADRRSGARRRGLSRP